MMQKVYCGNPLCGDEIRERAVLYDEKTNTPYHLRCGVKEQLCEIVAEGEFIGGNFSRLTIEEARKKIRKSLEEKVM
ncbi:hypothetical protein HZB00_00950 [Candidatus Woesearchaeota archaeon]|nr:hypothetical protein [Candidatus Woesearchaeota archaeon]